MLRNHYMGLILIFALLLSACGDGASTPEPPPSPQTGNLTITISGLPTAQDAKVDVTGPDSYSKTVSQTTTLTNLAIGDYQLTANSVSADNISFSASTESQTVTVSANRTASAIIKYGAPTTSIGVITGFGSVFVNGIEFETDSAQIETDDSDNAPESELEVGMVVTIQGTAGADGSQGDAAVIQYAAKVEGPIEAIDLAASTLTVLGQVFLVDELTQFENAGFTSLLIGDIVEISSVEDEAGNLVATRIEKESTGEVSFKLKGQITNLDEVAKTFVIGELTIDYRNAELEGTLENDALVKVKSSTGVSEGVLFADAVEVEDESLAPDQQLAVDGIIDSFDSVQSFTVNGQRVLTNEDTEFKGGDKSELVQGLHVKVFGRLNADGTLLARMIRLDKEGVIKLEGIVDAVDTDNSTLTVLGINIATDNHTQFVDESEAEIRQFDLTDIQFGDEVEVKAFAQNGTLVARIVTREETQAEADRDSDDTTSVEGPVTQILDSSFSIHGVIVHTSEVTEFEGPNEETLTASQFYALVKMGDKLEVEGVRQEDGSILALEVEFEHEQDEGNKQVEFEGIIDSFESVHAFTVNGHAITTDFKTRYENGGPDDLAVGVQVEIKGSQGDTGIILAKRIEFEQDSKREVELEGNIDSFTSITDFSLAGQAVTTDENTEYEHGTAQDLALDVVVEVEGILTEDGVVLATKIEFEEQDEVSLEGQIEHFVSATDFMVAGQAVTTNDNTEYEHGSVSMLAEGVFVEIEGILTQDNVLLAREIEFEEAEEVSVEGEITSFTSATEFVVGDQVVTTDEFTQYEHGTVDELALGVFVEVEGVLNSDSVLIAHKIEFAE